MNSNIRFSVAIPAFKGRHLKECIESVLCQTFKSYELIIVNDCSPDPIESIVEQYEDGRIRYFENEINIGAENLVLNWNKCLEMARGEFFLILGDDDRMEPGFLQEFDHLITKYNKLDVFHCRSKIIDEHSVPVTLTPSWPEFESVYENIWHKLFKQRVQFISDFVYRTSALKEKGGYYFFPMAWASDDISSFIAIGDKGIAHTNKPLLNYRRHSSSLSSSGNTEIKMESIMMQEEWYRNFLSKEPANLEDRILYENICQNIGKQIQKEKIYVMSLSFRTNYWANCIKWFNKRKEYKLSNVEIVYSVMEFLKVKIANQKYKI